MLARYLILLKRWKNLNNNIKKIILLFIFTFLAIIPFIYITGVFGFETFLDSFENSSNYLCIQDKENDFNSNTNGDYIIIQKATHPNFEVKKNDLILYCNYEGNISFTKINQISSVAAIKKYQIEKVTRENDNNVIFENQILGKIIEIIDENIINSISIKIWEASIHNLNFRALLVN